MTPFQEQIAADNAAVFINDMEFAEMHNLNGIECKAIVQDISIAQSLSVDIGKDDNYYGIYGERLQVNCLKDALRRYLCMVCSFIWMKGCTRWKAPAMIWAFLLFSWWRITDD